jgi:hypothetical protein
MPLSGHDSLRLPSGGSLASLATPGYASTRHFVAQSAASPHGTDRSVCATRTWGFVASHSCLAGPPMAKLEGRATGGGPTHILRYIFVSAGGYGDSLTMSNIAPCGSPITENRPTFGMSVGGTKA